MNTQYTLHLDTSPQTQLNIIFSRGHDDLGTNAAHVYVVRALPLSLTPGRVRPTLDTYTSRV